MRLADFLKRRLISPQLDQELARTARPAGSLGYDPWGYHYGTVKYSYLAIRELYHKYFRVTVDGIDRIPAEGPVIIVANHSGQLPIDGLLIGFALASRSRRPRLPRAMIDRFSPTMPYLGNLLNRLGGVPDDPVSCARLLANGEAIIIFPEGVRGAGKPYRERYQLKRFSTGFMRLAMEHNATIVPVGVIGCEETIPSLTNIAPLARLLGLPYFPLAAPVILPAKVNLLVGDPLEFNQVAHSEQQIAAQVQQVRTSLEALIAKGLERRRGVFL